MFLPPPIKCKINQYVLLILSLAALMPMKAISQPASFSQLLGCAVSESTPAGDTSARPENLVPICTDLSQIKYLRVAIHFLLPGGFVDRTINDCDQGATPFYYTGYGNFTENGDGFTNGGYNGYQRAEDIINVANQMLDNNSIQWRKANDPLVQNPPLNITYPSTPPTVPMRYLLTGVYFHRDVDAYTLSKTTTQIYNEYGVDKSNTINVFYTPYGPWTGAANNIGGPIKYIFCNEYFIYVQPTCRDWSLIFSGQNLNHEVGHTVGLRHTWSQLDGCDDTPEGFIYDKWGNNICIINQNANCWTKDPSIPTCPNSSGGKPCDEWYKVSNNIMDYNGNWPHAFTVCQTERINNDLANSGNAFVHSCDECAPAIAFFHINETIQLCQAPNTNGVVVMQAEASTNEDKYKIEICEVYPLDPTNCVSGSFNTGWLNGPIGIVDLSSIYTFQPNKHYKINLTVNNSECPTSSTIEKVIYTTPCNPDTTLGEGGNTGLRLTASNPINDYIHVFYELDRDGMLSLQLINLFSSQPAVLMQETFFTTGSYYQSFSTNTLPSGTYLLRSTFNNAVSDKTIIKP